MSIKFIDTSPFKIFTFLLRFFIFFIPLFDLRAEIERLIPVVISKIPHELPAFTQGLAIEEDLLYESTGLYGQSSLRIFDLSKGKMVRMLSLSKEIFAEGIAILPNQIIQITWREQKAFIYERKNLSLQKIFHYLGEGWGLCRDGSTVWMSNGTSILTQRNPLTFYPIRTLKVHLKGEQLDFLNDMECVGSDLYINVWLKDWIVRVDKKSGKVTGIIDASLLLSDFEKKGMREDDILNGIAYRPKTKTFFLTGKNWPWIYEVKFVLKNRKK